MAIINKETEKFNNTNQNIAHKIDSKIITNPQYISEQNNAIYIKCQKYFNPQ